jgi:hypothetical protein
MHNEDKSETTGVISVVREVDEMEGATGAVNSEVERTAPQHAIGVASRFFSHF